MHSGAPANTAQRASPPLINMLLRLPLFLSAPLTPFRTAAFAQAVACDEVHLYLSRTRLTLSLSASLLSSSPHRRRPCRQQRRRSRRRASAPSRSRPWRAAPAPRPPSASSGGGPSRTGTGRRSTPLAIEKYHRTVCIRVNRIYDIYRDGCIQPRGIRTRHLFHGTRVRSFAAAHVQPAGGMVHNRVEEAVTSREHGVYRGHGVWRIGGVV